VAPPVAPRWIKKDSSMENIENELQNNEFLKLLLESIDAFLPLAG